MSHSNNNITVNTKVVWRLYKGGFYVERKAATDGYFWVRKGLYLLLARASELSLWTTSNDGSRLGEDLDLAHDVSIDNASSTYELKVNTEPEKPKEPPPPPFQGKFEDFQLSELEKDSISLKKKATYVNRYYDGYFD